MTRPTKTGAARLVVRMPRAMHGQLVALARSEGVSMNQLVVGALARALGSHDRSQQGQSVPLGLEAQLVLVEERLAGLAGRIAALEEDDRMRELAGALADLEAELASARSPLALFAAGVGESLRADPTAGATAAGDEARRQRIRDRVSDRQPAV